MKVNRKDLPRVFKPIYERVVKINTRFNKCNTWDCGTCEYYNDKDCYEHQIKDIEEVYRFTKGVLNGVKKMD